MSDSVLRFTQTVPAPDGFRRFRGVNIINQHEWMGKAARTCISDGADYCFDGELRPESIIVTAKVRYRPEGFPPTGRIEIDFDIINFGEFLGESPQ